MAAGNAGAGPKGCTDEPGLDYAAAGVSTEQAEAALDRLARNVRSTWATREGTGRVLLELGHFANVVEVAGQGIAFCTDGVGSKALVAQMLGRYDTIGIDCIAMNVNDLICVGATPVSMVDYLAVESAEPAMLEQISVGLAEGASQAGISISGGEIAQLPGMIHGTKEGNGFDIVGAAIGHVDLSRILIGRDVRPGDVVIGVASNGIHSNGLTLARHVLFEEAGFAVDGHLDGLERTIGEELLRPTLIYVREALEILRDVPGVKGFVHITGDGFLNLTRLAPLEPVAYVIDAPPPVPPVFDLIQRLGRVSDAEMFRVFNMGVGLCCVAEEAAAATILEILERHGRQASRIGHVEAAETTAVRIPDKRLVGIGNAFEAVTD